MAYCRWSSDNFQSDVYVYLTVSGSYTVHICKMKFQFHPDYPHPSMPLKEDRETLKKYLSDFNRAMDKATLIENETTKEYSDKSFSFDTLKETIDFLLELRSNGLHIPDVAIQVMRQEIEEGFE